MPKYLLRRFAEMLITLFLIATATFFLLEAVPGDPLTERASKLSPTVKENLYKLQGRVRRICCLCGTDGTEADS